MQEATQQDQQLERWIKVAQDLFPSVRFAMEGERLLISYSKKRVRVPVSRTASSGTSLDLSTGLLRVEADGLLIYLQGPTALTRLTPFLGALLARLILPIAMPQRACALTLDGPQSLLAKEWSREIGTEISPVAVNKLLLFLKSESAIDVDSDDLRRLDFARCLSLVLRDFRLDGIGRATPYSAPRDTLEQVEAELEAGLARGVTETLSKIAGGWVQPRDFIIESARTPQLTKLLGPPSRGSTSETVLVRRTSRVPLRMLAPAIPESGRLVLNPLLATAEALNSTDPVVRELGENLRTKWSSR